MSALVKIFAPIAEVQTALNDINVVAFDTMGTLVHYGKTEKGIRNYLPDYDVARLFKDISININNLGLQELVIISGDTFYAAEALEAAGLNKLHNKEIENRSSFYQRMKREGKKVLVVDDDYLLGMMAQAHVDPKNKDVRKYLSEKRYRAELNFNP